MMTTFAAIFGALPIALGSGEGAELRQPLGVAVVGGFCCRSCSRVHHAVIYVYLDRIDRVLKRRLDRSSRIWRGAAQAGGRGGIIIGQASGRALEARFFRLGNAGLPETAVPPRHRFVSSPDHGNGWL